MNRSILLAYQLFAGALDTVRGFMLLIAPVLTSRLMHLHASASANIYLSLIGAYVFAVGLAYLFGAYLVIRRGCRRMLESVWLLTAFTGTSAATFVVSQILANALAVGWIAVAVTDTALVLIQAVGLRKGWLKSVQQ